MNDKIKSIDELSTIAAQARADGRKVVLAHGVFDILHIGHKRHLEVGKRNGELLLVTITTDPSAVIRYPVSILTGRIWSGCLPSIRILFSSISIPNTSAAW